MGEFLIGQAKFPRLEQRRNIIFMSNTVYVIQIITKGTKHTKNGFFCIKCRFFAYEHLERGRKLAHLNFPFGFLMYCGLK